MSNRENSISMSEHLSALLDDETGSFEERRVLDELKSDQHLSKKLANYALIGETMRAGESQQSAMMLGSSFLDSIHDKIDKEDQFDNVILDQTQTSQVGTNTTAANSPSYLRPIGGFALAASVGALAFMGLQNVGVLEGPTSIPSNIVDKSGPTAIAEVKSEVNNVESTEIITFNSDEYVDADAHTRSMLKRYVDSHMQYTMTSTFVPSVRTIAYTDNQ